jgi:hypothetical protein
MCLVTIGEGPLLHESYIRLSGCCSCVEHGVGWGVGRWVHSQAAGSKIWRRDGAALAEHGKLAPVKSACEEQKSACEELL